MTESSQISPFIYHETKEIRSWKNLKSHTHQVQYIFSFFPVLDFVDKRAGISKIFMSFSDPPPRFCQRSISIQIYTNIFAITIKMNNFLVILSQCVSRVVLNSRHSLEWPGDKRKIMTRVKSVTISRVKSVYHHLFVLAILYSERAL